jgi:hypothetical protein
MKITEILNERLIDTKVKEIPVKDLSNFKADGKGSSGHYSSVKGTTDPHLKTKTAKDVVKAQRDPYWNYAELCIEHQDHNPYFPRIYSYKKFTDQNGHVIPKVKMETLHDLHEVSFEAVKGYFTSLLGDLDYIQSEETDESFVHSAIATRLKDIYYGNNLEGVNDHKLVECLQIIKKYVSDTNIKRSESGEHPISLDLHSQNFMIRMSSGGIHLVITDPLAGEVVWSWDK